jgi:amino acid transporter
MHQSKLPADPTALILGIVALVIGFAGCCCYGLFALIPLILSIVGLIMANKSLKEFDQNPNVFSHQSRSNVSIGRILNIIALIFNGILVLVVIVFFVFYGTILSTELIDEYKKRNQNIEYELENDSVSDRFEYIEEIDSTYVDSAIVNE